MAEKINSTFALLDVKHGRLKLAKRVNAGEDRIPVTIRGHIVNVWSADDGTSIEFEVQVSDAVERVR